MFEMKMKAGTRRVDARELQEASEGKAFLSASSPNLPWSGAQKVLLLLEVGELDLSTEALEGSMGASMATPMMFPRNAFHTQTYI